MAKDILEMTPENRATFFGSQCKVKIHSVLSIDNTLMKTVRDTAKKAGFILDMYDPTDRRHVNVQSLYPGANSIYRGDVATVMIAQELTKERTKIELLRMVETYGMEEGTLVVCRNQGLGGLYEQKCIITKMGPAVSMNMSCDSAMIKLETPILRKDYRIYKDIVDWDAYNKKREASTVSQRPWVTLKPDDLMYFEKWASIDDLMLVAGWLSIKDLRKTEIEEIVTDCQLAMDEDRFDDWYEDNHKKFNLINK